MKEVHLAPFQSSGRAICRIGCAGLNPLDVADVLDVAGRAVAATTGEAAWHANRQAQVEKTAEGPHTDRTFQCANGRYGRPDGKESNGQLIPDTRGNRTNRMMNRRGPSIARKA